MGSVQFGMFVEQVATTVTSATPVAMTSTSLQIQEFTGSTAQTVKLPPTGSPNAVVGQFFEFYNQSSATITMQYQDGTSFTPSPTILAGGALVVTLISTGTANGTWVVESPTTAAATSGLRTINAQVGTTYTFALSDGSGFGDNPLVTFGSASATTVTIPTNLSVPFPVGTQIDCIQVGAGAVTFAAAGGVTLEFSGSATISQYVFASLVQVSANTWVLAEDN